MTRTTRIDGRLLKMDEKIDVIRYPLFVAAEALI